MASPVVVSATESNATADDASPFTVSRTAGVNGQLTIVVIGTDGQPTLTWPTGYTQFYTQSRAGGFTIYGAYHQEDGTEGATFDIVSSASEKWAAIVYSISGASTPAQQVPEATTVDGSTATANPDPPSVTPTGGSKDYLFIAAINNDGEEADDDTWGNTSPTNYTPSPPRQKSTAVAGAASTNCSLETAERALTTAGPEDPGTFANDVSHTYVGATMVIHPAPPATPARVTAEEVTLDYNIATRVTAEEITLDYNVAARVTAEEVVLDYNIAVPATPTRVTAVEIVLDYYAVGEEPPAAAGGRRIVFLDLKQSERFHMTVSAGMVRRTVAQQAGKGLLRSRETRRVQLTVPLRRKTSAEIHRKEAVVQEVGAIAEAKGTIRTRKKALS